MMKTRLIFLAVGLALNLSATQPIAQGAETLSPPKTQWSAKMQELYKTLSELLTNVCSTQRFNDPKNRPAIDKQAQKLSSLSHGLKNIKPSKDSDPTIQIIGGLFERDTRRAYNELKKGNREYARGILRSVPDYCMGCHTRNASGPQFSNLPLEPIANNLRPLDRADFFSATRQFDRAQNEYMKIISEPSISKSISKFYEWERAVYQSLAIAVRVRKDPSEAQKIVQGVLSKDSAPSFLKQDAKQWKTSVEEWQKEGKRTSTTQEGLMSEAIRLMSKAHEIQKYPMDRTGDIYYLRATSTIHDLLQTDMSSEKVADAFLLAGIAYEVLSPRSLEELHEIYYESCVRRSPHTATAESCYQRYESAMYRGYTGSGGTSLPSSVLQDLEELKSLAQPKALPPS